MAYVLIADDDELVAALASDALIDAGHPCGWVTNGIDAWDLLQNRRPDVLLLDQDMPGMTGSTLLRKIRNSAHLYDLPVIMFTALTGQRDEEQAIYAGAQDYLRKPFNPRRLIDRVETMLEKRAGRGHTDLRTYLEQSSGWSSEPKTAARRAI